MTGTASDVHRSSVAYPRAFVRRVASVTQATPAGRPEHHVPACCAAKAVGDDVRTRAPLSLRRMAAGRPAPGRAE